MSTNKSFSYAAGMEDSVYLRASFDAGFFEQQRGITLKNSLKGFFT